MRIYYQNSKGRFLDLMSWPYKIAESSLFDYGWGYDSMGENRISRFRREIQDKSVTVSIAAPSPEEYERAAEGLYEVLEQDVLSRSPGRLYVNDSYLSCYFYKSEKAEFQPDRNFLSNIFTLVTETGRWITEDFYEFKTGTKRTRGDKKYIYRYAYRYAGGLENAHVNNKHFADVDFRLIIYGFCVNPQIVIGRHRYQINILLEAGEYLFIDSAARTVKKIMNNGAIVDAFHNRDKTSSVFQKIPPGRNTVGWPGTFDFDIILYGERSEPKWQSWR